MAWETAYQRPEHLLEDGFSIVNASWMPLYVVGQRKWSPEQIYGWRMDKLDRDHGFEEGQ